MKCLIVMRHVGSGDTVALKEKLLLGGQLDESKDNRLDEDNSLMVATAYQGVVQNGKCQSERTGTRTSLRRTRRKQEGNSKPCDWPRCLSKRTSQVTCLEREDEIKGSGRFDQGCGLNKLSLESLLRSYCSLLYYDVLFFSAQRFFAHLRNSTIENSSVHTSHIKNFGVYL